ncbi:MAG: hypothetical protein EXQ81_10485 [Thermoleophilia bacterium]|nr:hypothetical protein [Thermoleophilia bacterium]
MLRTICALLLAGTLSAAATPGAMWLSRRIGLVAALREDRWRPERSVPLLGGAAIAFGALIAVVGLEGYSSSAVIAGCALAAFAFGLLDDFRHLAPSSKLAGQVLLGAALYFGGVRVEIVQFPPAAFLLTVVWVVGMMNAINLMDNMDGLAAGVTGIAALALAAGAVALPGEASILAAATAGAAFGFLVFNFYPARIFMGDGGSQLLGFLLAAAALVSTNISASNLGLSLIGPLAILALPIFDTALVTLSRTIAGISIGQGGRDHTSHRLAALGMSDRGAVLFLYAVAAGLALIGALASTLSSLIVPVAVLALVGLVLFGIFLQEVDVYGWGRRAATGTLQRKLRHDLLVYLRFGAEVGLDAVLLTVAYYSSFLIRFEGPPAEAWLYLFVQSVPVVVVIQLAVLLVSGAYRVLWRYVGISDLILIVRAAAIGTVASALALIAIYRFEGYSRGALVIDALLMALLLAGSRVFTVWLSHWFSIRPRDDSVRVLIAGADERGAMAHRLLSRSTERAYRVVGFLDDDPGKRHRHIAGVRVVGTVAEFPACAERFRAEVLVMALDRPEEATARMRAEAEAVGVEYREFPLPG